MNWDAIGAIGEVVGAGGVVVTLLFLGLQIRANQRALVSSTLSASRRGRVATAALLSDHADLLVRLDAGEELSEAERHRVGIVVASLVEGAAFDYLTRAALGSDTAFVIRDHAGFLHDRPGLRRMWMEHVDRAAARRQDIDAAPIDRWATQVKADLARLDGLEKKGARGGAA